MRVLVVAAAVLAVASASIIREDVDKVILGKESLATADIKTKELIIMKLLNHILEPTIYEDIREVAKTWVIEDNLDKYQNNEVVKKFMELFKEGMLPRGEVFVHTNEKHMEQAVRVFRLLYFAKDFDTMVKTACWLRERINRGMFVHVLYVAVFHREDCRGIVLPAPYEVYPFFFVDNTIINKAYMMKVTKGVVDPAVMDYYGIRKITDKNVVMIDMRKGVRHAMSHGEVIAYFTEDIDLNTYMYYLYMNYPYWMTDEVYGLQKERRGEVMMYAYQQLLARIRLERVSHFMCDIKTLMWDIPLKTGYWPKLCMHNGECMPVRSNNVMVLNENNIREKEFFDDIERIVHDGILKGHVTLNGVAINMKKPEDIEMLSRMLLGGLGLGRDDAKHVHVTNMFKRILTYSTYNVNKDSYIPTALDMYVTCLRDPVFWKMMKRIAEHAVIFKHLLPNYTREQVDFPGVKVEKIVTDKLVTFMDNYDMDITNAVVLDETERKKKHSDMVYVARTRRLNNQPFKVTIDVESDKTVDAVVRIFIGPKFDCLGRLLTINDARLGMVEMDTFLYKLQAGKNTITRNSVEMHGVINDRPWTRMMWERVSGSESADDVQMPENWWYKTRMGFPRRLLLPIGTKGGMPLTMFVIVTPVRTGLVLPFIDVKKMQERHVCPWSTCIDTMPLGFPFDRHITVGEFFTPNMKKTDVFVFRKDMDVENVSKDVDFSNMVMKRDDYTYLDTDMLVKRSYRHIMMAAVPENMTPIVA